MTKKIFSKNAAQREIFFNIGQYFLVFWEKVVSIWSVFWEKVVSIVVSILTFFLLTTVVITATLSTSVLVYELLTSTCFTLVISL